MIIGIGAFVLLSRTGAASKETSTSTGTDTSGTPFNDALFSKSQTPGNTYVYNLEGPRFPEIRIPPAVDMPKDSGGNIAPALTAARNSGGGISGGYGAIAAATSVGARAPTVLNSAGQLVHAPAAQPTPPNPVYQAFGITNSGYKVK